MHNGETTTPALTVMGNRLIPGNVPNLKNMYDLKEKSSTQRTNECEQLRETREKTDGGFRWTVKL